MRIGTRGRYALTIMFYLAKNYDSKKYVSLKEISESGFITKGDANKNIDLNEVKFNKALGKGTNWSIPYIGYYADFIYKNKWILLIILGMLIYNSLLLNYVEEDNEDNN